MATAPSMPILHQTFVECDGCEAEKDVTWYCITCRTNLCDTCKTARVHRKHTIKSWLDPGSISARHDNPIPCAQHPEETCRNYCTTCKVLSCPICVAGTHSGHQFDTLDKVLERNLNSLKSNLAELKDKFLPKAERSIQEIQTKMDDGKKKCAENKTTIKLKVAALTKQLAEMETKLAEAEDEINEKYTQDLTKQLEEADIKKKRISNRIKEIEDNISTMNKSSIINAPTESSDLTVFATKDVKTPHYPGFKETTFVLPPSASTIGTSEQVATIAMEEKLPYFKDDCSTKSKIAMEEEMPYFKDDYSAKSMIAMEEEMPYFKDDDYSAKSMIAIKEEMPYFKDDYSAKLKVSLDPDYSMNPVPRQKEKENVRRKSSKGWFRNDN